MKCPIDQTDLQINSKEGIVGHCCSQCQGVFLTGRVVLAFKHNFETTILEQSFNNNSMVGSSIQCSSCHNQMKKAAINSIEIDLCEKCKGIWFDRYEVEEIISQYRENHSATGFGLINFLPFLTN